MAYHNQFKRGEVVAKGGVLDYIAPEKINSNSFDIAHSRADFCSEVYQIGLIGYIIFFGKLPFDAPTWSALADKITHEVADFTHPICPIPSQFLQFLQRAMAKNPTQRFASAIEMQTVFGFE